jgi:hypothetical protein
MSHALPPKPENTVFGLVIDGKLKSIGFPSVEAAEGAAPAGHKVEIVDRVTMKVIKWLSGS